jgi:hypothetical protein
MLLAALSFPASTCGIEQTYSIGRTLFIRVDDRRASRVSATVASRFVGFGCGRPLFGVTTDCRTLTFALSWSPFGLPKTLCTFIITFHTRHGPFTPLGNLCGCSTQDTEGVDVIISSALAFKAESSFFVYSLPCLVRVEESHLVIVTDIQLHQGCLTHLIYKEILVDQSLWEVSDAYHTITPSIPMIPKATVSLNQFDMGPINDSVENLESIYSHWAMRSARTCAISTVYR